MSRIDGISKLNPESVALIEEYYDRAIKIAEICFYQQNHRKHLSDFEIIAHNALIYAATKFDPSKGQCFEKFFVKIFKCEIVDYYRTYKTREYHNDEPVSIHYGNSDSFQDVNLTYFDNVDKQDSDELLHTCLNQLPARHRSFLDRIYLQNKSYAEVASEDNIPVGTVKSFSMTSRQRLRHLLERAS